MIEPYYNHAGITIYHGDCGEIMPQLDSVDLTLIDPPYGIEFQSCHRSTRYNKMIGDGYLPLKLIEAAIDKAKRAAYVFCRWDNLVDLPKPKSVLVWVKNNWSMGDLKHEHGRQWEAICFYPKDGHEFVKRIPDVLMCSRISKTLHPTEKPVGVISALVNCNKGNVILDSFMGSGTTLVAVKRLGREAIGIEIEEKYCEIAAKRLAQEVLPL